MEHMSEKEERAERIGRIEKILSSHGIKMAVGGCGCCGSPWVSFEYLGEKILASEDYCDFEME